MQIILCDRNGEVTEAWEKLEWPDNVRILNTDFREIPNIVPDATLAICSAGNSYGVMGGGIDRTIDYTFNVQRSVQEHIKTMWYGELPVGSAELIHLPPRFIPWSYLIYTPTMRVPEIIIMTSNVYIAMRAALRVGETLDATLVIPGFGGSCGRVPPVSIAKQMFLAYNNHTYRD